MNVSPYSCFNGWRLNDGSKCDGMRRIRHILRPIVSFVKPLINLVLDSREKLFDSNDLGIDLHCVGFVPKSIKFPISDLMFWRSVDTPPHHPLLFQPFRGMICIVSISGPLSVVGALVLLVGSICFSIQHFREFPCCTLVLQCELK